MKIELKIANKLKVTDLHSGDVFICNTNDGFALNFLAMYVKDTDGSNPIIVDLEDNAYYTDVDKYGVVSLLNCKLVQIDE